MIDNSSLLQQVFFGRSLYSTLSERVGCDCRRQLCRLLVYKLLPSCGRDDRSLSPLTWLAALGDGDVITSHSLNHVWVDIQAPSGLVDVVEENVDKMSPIFFILKIRYFDTDISGRIEMNLIKEIRHCNSNITSLMYTTLRLLWSNKSVGSKQQCILTGLLRRMWSR